MRANRRLAALLTTAAFIGALAFAGALPAAAEPDPDGPPPGAPEDPFTDMVITGWDLSTGTTGVVGTVQTPPPAYPATAVGTETGHLAARIQVVDPADPGHTANVYCIDLLTSTTTGVGYTSGSWSDSNVPNLMYIGYILTNYFPQVPTAPAGLTDTQRVAAVQTAIWYFSDGYVLSDDFDPTVRAATTAIVADALANADGTPPFTPSITIDPATGVIPDDGTIAGPFTVTSNVTATVEDIAGLDVFLDADRTEPLTEGDPVPNGTQFWVETDGPGPDRWVQLVYESELPAGTVYLFDPQSDPNRQTAQKLILAQDETLPTRAGVEMAVYAAGSIQARKHIEGPGAGLQGDITIEVLCDDLPVEGVPTSWTIPAGSPAGDYDFAFSGLPIGADCTITETANGVNGNVVLQSTTIVPGGVTVGDVPQTVLVTNRYERPLPATGFDGGSGALAAAVLLLLGGALVLTVRRARA